MKRLACLAVVVMTGIISGASSAVAADFARDIQPIFAGHCYECHGPEKQKGKLRLDQSEPAKREGDQPLLTPGKPEQSELYRRITLPKGHEDIMPNRGEPLNKRDIELVREWIASGASWPEKTGPVKHWAYTPPVRPALPKVSTSNWPKNAIDRFILARLEKEKLPPSPEVDRARLLRRVYLDLIGLPPSPAEVKAFLADQSERAYEKVVDRLLALPQYGERWARPWLDLARYADSSGYQRDNLWEIWPYRDWVIKALNADMPFDQFTIEQIAGDLLPGATLDQKIATGFNRCAAINVEAGSDQEESRVNQVFDRVNTLGTVWLGSTIECAQCHNHKYDPFTQKEYYQLFSFFNNTPKESEYANPKTTIALEFAGPYLKLPDPKIESRRAAIEEQVQTLERDLAALSKTLATGQTEWESSTSNKLASLVQTHELEISKFETESGTPHEILPDKSVLIRDDGNDAVPERDSYTATVRTALKGITGFKLEALADSSLPGGGPGRGDDKRPNFILTDFKVTVASSPEGKPETIKFQKTRASFEQKKFPVAKVIDGDPKSGWGITPQFSRDHWARFDTASPIGSGEDTTLTFTLAQNYGGGRLMGRLRLSAFTGDTSAEEIPAEVASALAKPAEQRSAAQKKRLSEYRLSSQPAAQKLQASRAKLNTELKNLRGPRTLAMEEMGQPRASSIFVRGNFLEKGEPVQPNVPAIFHPLPDGPRNRLTLASWLAGTNNPLVARVTVNRWWGEFFGHGLVGTSEDFGIKGDRPTHPELLDWLACEFMEGAGSHPWSMKHIHRLIVTSAAYRQSSSLSERVRELDDQNLLYARGPRVRMDAEMIRDNALSAGSLLSLKMGGPPVHPYQPPGIWENKVGGVAVSYEISEGEDRYRRGVYTVLKRTSPYPGFITFDAPTRNACVVRRPRSNTPLQALTLLNDPVYVEAAAALAKRVLKEKSGDALEARLRHAFELCAARIPNQRELQTLTRLYEEQLQSSRKDLAAAEKLSRQWSKPEGIGAAEFAAWFSVASALLNLDETITKG